MNKTCNRCLKTKPIEEFKPYYKKLVSGSVNKHFLSTCKECVGKQNRAYLKEYSKNNKHKRKIYVAQNRNKIKNTTNIWRKKNQDKIRIQSKIRLKRFRRLHPEKRRFEKAMRRESIILRTPSYADLEAIKKFYENCPAGYQVDHIVPLQGKTISGLHILENLQYLTPNENAKKGNRFPYYPLDFYRKRGLSY